MWYSTFKKAVGLGADHECQKNSAGSGRHAVQCPCMILEDMVWWKSGFSMQSMEVQPGKLVRGQTTYLTVRTGSKRRDVRRRSSFLIEYPTYASQIYLGGKSRDFFWLSRMQG